MLELELRASGRDLDDVLHHLVRAITQLGVGNRDSCSADLHGEMRYALTGEEQPDVRRCPACERDVPVAELRQGYLCRECGCVCG